MKLSVFLNLVEKDTAGLNLGAFKLDTEKGVIITDIGGKTYEFTPTDRSASELFSSVTGMAKHSTGRALAYLKQHATGKPVTSRFAGPDNAKSIKTPFKESSLSEAQQVYLSKTHSGKHGFFTNNMLAWSLSPIEYEKYSKDKVAAKEYAKKLGFEFVDKQSEALNISEAADQLVLKVKQAINNFDDISKYGVICALDYGITAAKKNDANFVKTYGTRAVDALTGKTVSESMHDYKVGDGEKLLTDVYKTVKKMAGNSNFSSMKSNQLMSKIVHAADDLGVSLSDRSYMYQMFGEYEWEDKFATAVNELFDSDLSGKDVKEYLE